MNEALARVRDVFLEPPGDARAVAPPPVMRPPERLAVLGAPGPAAACAALLLLGLARSTAARCALLATWGDGVAPRRALPSSPAAGRVAAALRARAVPATSSGRLVRVELPPEPPDADDMLRRASAVVRGPVALALSRTRTDQVDCVLALHEVIVVVEPRSGSDATTALALESLSRLGPEVCRRAAPSPLLGALALAGAWLPGGYEHLRVGEVRA